MKRVKIDKQEAASVVENKLNRSRWWAYKWLHRFDKDGLERLKDKEKTGTPPDVIEEIMVEIRKELSDSNTGWDFRQVMDMRYTRSGVRYHEVHIYRLLHTWGFKCKVPQKRFVNVASVKDKKRFKKE